MDRIKALINDKDKPVRWVFYGDSITHGVEHTFGMRDYTELFEERVRGELRRNYDMVINAAISGNKTSDLLASFDLRIVQNNPDVVFLMIGMNDCSERSGVSLQYFEENLNTLAEKISALDAELVMQTTCPILPGTAPDRYDNLGLYMDIIRKVAGERDLPLIDHHKFWEKNGDKLYYWMSNEYHPNGFGHLAFAYHIFKEMDIYNPAHPGCNLFFPL